MITRLLINFFLLISTLGFSQEGSPVYFKQLSVNDGLSQNSVISIAQDSTGYLYFATQDGLNKYSGSNFEQFPFLFDDVTKENYNTLGKVYIDSFDNLFIISKGGHLKKFHSENNTFKDFGEISNVRSIAEGKNQSLWIGTETKGFYHLDKNGVQISANQLEAMGTSVNAFILFRDSMLVGTSNGLITLDKEAIRNTSRIDIHINCFTIRKDSLWVGSQNNGLFYSHDGNSLTQFIGFDKDNAIPSELSILSILTDSKNRIWLGTYGDGAYKIDFTKKTVQHFTAKPLNPKALQYDDILSLYEDYTQTIWLGTDGAGLSYYDENLFKFNSLTNYDIPVFANIDVIRAITRDAEGKLWLGSSAHGLTYYNPKIDKYRSYRFNPKTEIGIPSDRVMSLLTDEDNLWIGFQEAGLTILKPNNVYEHFTETSSPPLIASTIWCIYKDSQNRIWLGTRDNGLIEFDLQEGMVRNFRHNPNNLNSISSNNIRVIKEDNYGHLWIGTESSGLNRLNTETEIIERYNQTDIQNVKSLLDTPKILWIGTNGQGLQALDKNTKKLKGYTTKDGLPNNVIYSILPDDNNRFWLSTNRGLAQFNLDSLNIPTIVNYDVEDGLQTLEFNTGASHRDQNGTLYFGGLKGINWLQPSEIIKNLIPPKTSIANIELFNREIPFDTTSTFKSTSNTFSFHFVGLHFSQPEQNKYSYILENGETEWSKPSNNNFAHYTNLPPGDYTFKVVSSNYDDIWDETHDSYSFTINKPWYLSNWALLLYFLSALLLVYFIYAYLKWKWRLEMELRLEHEEANRLQNLDELKSKLYANISHEFRTPLTLISGPVQQLLEKSDLDKTSLNSLGIIEESSQRLLRLVNQMLDLSKLEEGSVLPKIEKHNPFLQLTIMVKAFSVSAEQKGISIGSSIIEIQSAWYDKDILEKIVSNLLSNAVKYSPNNSEIQFNVTLKNDQLSIVVENENETLSETEMTQLFERFYRKDTSTLGTGIGLSLIKELSLLSDGSVSAHRKDNSTVAFSVLLPIKLEAHTETLKAESVLEEDPIAERSKTPIKATKSGEKPILLIVEDNTELIRFITSIFETEYEIVQAKNGALGIKQAFLHIPDIIISDIMMPEKDGMELTQTLKTDIRTNHIPIVLLTAKSGDENKLKGLENKADEYLTKPFNVNILKQKVENILSMQKILRKHYSENHILQPKEIVSNSSNELLFQKIQEVIDTKITESQFTAAGFADELGLSRMQLHRKLKALTGLSTTEFIRSQRLKSATQLMESTDLTISEIAYSVGFNSPSYFNTCFKNQYGMSPAEYSNKL